ncbi:MAG: FtsQ-type POTRA domain-containing protein [Deltaproteobacteria bacterium]|nr:FtsQ-type POTRA domain-containing protein [Deltaproteobacteria bacterium]
MIKKRRGAARGHGSRLLRALMQVAALVAVAGIGVSAGYLGVRLRVALQTGELFELSELLIEGTQLIPADEIRGYSGLGVGRGLYGFDAEAVERAIAEHPLVSSVRLVRRPPHTLRILIEEQRPVAYAALGHLYAVNSRGELFARAEALCGRELPVISGLEPEVALGAAGADVSGLVSALQVMAGLQRAGLEPARLSEVHVDPALGVDLTLIEPAVLVHLGNGRYGDKLDQLAVLERALKERARRASEIFFSDGPDPRRVVVRFVQSEMPATMNSASGEIAAPKGKTT